MKGYARTKTENERELSIELGNYNGRNSCVVEHCRKHHCQYHQGKISASKKPSIKSSGNEKVRVIACCTTTADEMKIKPFLALHGAKREAAALNEDFKHYCVRVSS